MDREDLLEDFYKWANEALEELSTPEVMGPDSRCTPDWYVGSAYCVCQYEDSNQ